MDFKPPDNPDKNGPPFHDFARPNRFSRGRNRNVSPMMRENNHPRVSVQDRLGNNMKRGGNGNGNVGNQPNFPNQNYGNRGGGRNFMNQNSFNNGTQQPWFNRKRTSRDMGNDDTNSQSSGMHNPKRWKQNKNPNQPYNQNPAQNRLKNLRNRFSDSAETSIVKDDVSSIGDISETPGEPLMFHVENKQQVEEEATDITVEVVNNLPAAEVAVEELPTKFKMVLTQKLQNSIRMIQEKRKEKQVIIPYPVKPNITMMSTHERFTLL